MAQKSGHGDVNTNCLHGMGCRCGSTGPFVIRVNANCRVGDDGTDWLDKRSGTDVDWGDTSPCECVECGFAGIVADFRYVLDDDLRSLLEYVEEKEYADFTDAINSGDLVVHDAGIDDGDTDSLAARSTKHVYGSIVRLRRLLTDEETE